jgi:hypothetical protein
LLRFFFIQQLVDEANFLRNHLDLTARGPLPYPRFWLPNPPFSRPNLERTLMWRCFESWPFGQ